MSSTTAPAQALDQRTGVRETLAAKAHVLREELLYGPLIILVGVAFTLRLATMAIYHPAIMTLVDSARFARVDPTGLFSDFYMPAVYAGFLQLLHAISDQVWFSIVIQHLGGIAAGLIVFLAMRRLGLRPAIACVPTACILLAGDHLYLEHVFMADWLLLALSIAGLAAGVRGLVPAIDHRWLVAAGALLAAAGLTRSVGIVLPGCSPLPPSSPRPDPRPPAGRRSGTGGRRRDPGRLLRRLCAQRWQVRRAHRLRRLEPLLEGGAVRRLQPLRPARQGPGSCARTCRPPGVRARSATSGSPTRSRGPTSTRSARRPASRWDEFARQAILHQPLDYLEAVGEDFVRYFDPDAGSRARSPARRRTDLVRLPGPRAERNVVDALELKYDGVELSAPGAQALGTYQAIFRVGGVVLLAAFVATVLGMFLARGALRLGTVLFGLSALALYLVPVIDQLLRFSLRDPARGADRDLRDPRRLRDAGPLPCRRTAPSVLQHQPQEALGALLLGVVEHLRRRRPARRSRPRP